jgi:hypothetical protein
MEGQEDGTYLRTHDGCESQGWKKVKRVDTIEKDERESEREKDDG